MIEPCFEIDTAVVVDRLVHSHLYHLCFTFPYSAPRGCTGYHLCAPHSLKAAPRGPARLAHFE
ncbi:hypothetical protein DMX07_15540 [Pseudomonas soli]|uniref:Uncharacterized protein n=1 Tax=Pseudomonas soli TaxID=1306993 RepID=A0A2V4IH45_9PSED|nr:hypothetical protein DMX07_15540 [Pseudomonas soli]